MKPISSVIKVLIIYALSILITFLLIWGCDRGDSGKVSEFGQYEGYSEPIYDAWVRSSLYVTMRDGVKLAVDIIRPAIDSVAIEKPLPLVWTHTRYHRARNKEGKVLLIVDYSPELQRLVMHGYIVAAVDVRGAGASFGRYEGVLSPAETMDALEITEWFAKQPWCDGNIGMFGRSYLGMTQYMAVSQSPPSLKAIFPSVAGFDLYDLVYPGGVYRDDFIEHWGLLTHNLDINIKAPTVDEDPEGKMRATAIADHADNWDVIKEAGSARYRDYDVPSFSWSRNNPSAHLNDINNAKIPAYHWNGWFDGFVTDATIWYANYAGPQKMVIGPWSHNSTGADSSIRVERSKLLAIEQHRWFDYWLKGIDNGIMDEPSIHYVTIWEPNSWTWHSADTWPLENTQPIIYYFASGPSGTVKSVNDGVLTTKQPGLDSDYDRYGVDFSTTTGTATRWDNCVAQGPMVYPDMTQNDQKSLTYTTELLNSDVIVTGHPIVTLYITSTEQDGDFHALLEEVDEMNVSNYVTEGVLRASHRKLSEAPWNNLDLPYQRSYKSDIKDLPSGEVTKLTFDLHPTSNVFNKGHRIRVTIMCADVDNTEQLKFSNSPTVKVYYDEFHASNISLPLLSKTELLK